jgi:hypothetical protein
MGCGREAPNRAAGVLRRAFPHDPDPRQAERRARHESVKAKFDFAALAPLLH